MTTFRFSLCAAVLVAACGGATSADPAVSLTADPAGGSTKDKGASAPAVAEEATGSKEDPAPKTAAPERARPTSGPCTETRPPGDDDAGPKDTCSSDVECTDGSNGRCSRKPAGHRDCTYDDCTTDDDCGGGTVVCGCGVGTGKRNVCLTLSECRSNADCAERQYCRFSTLPGWPIEMGSSFYGQAWGYFCTTPSDLCRTDDDCEGNSHDHTCVYYTSSKQWGCGGGP